jgi:hypothetical protein
MSFWDYLASPAGDQVEHALIGLIAAITAWISWRTHRRIKRH